MASRLITSPAQRNYRATAISRARAAGISPADAAIAFGVDTKTAQKFYASLDEAAISDAVFRKLIDG